VSAIKTAADLKKGQSGIIKGYTDSVVSLKLMEMGCLPGTVIKLNFSAPFGDPISIDVAGYNLSLRLSEASNILIDITGE
jgi:ferrous iron transport protein A